MVPLSIMGMTGWVNPCCLAVRRPWILFVARRWSAGAFFCGPPRGFALWGLRRAGGGSRWSAAARDAPGRHNGRTPWLQEPWMRRSRCTPHPSTRWQLSWRWRSDRLLRHRPLDGCEEMREQPMTSGLACQRVPGRGEPWRKRFGWS